MHPLRGIFQFRRALLVFVALGALFAFTGEAFAQGASPVLSHVTSRSAFDCVAGPRVQAPPALKRIHTATPLKAACGAGQVPQPRPAAAVGLKGIAPALAQRGVHPNIASGYHYVYGYQFATAVGAEGFFSQHAPFLSPSDSHTLAETAGESSDGRQIVEIGWTVDRGVNGDTNPHLFIFHWVNSAPTCYNGCGYVQYSSDLYPGMTVASDGSAPLYAMENYQGNWWLWYNTEWIGYFPGTLWSSAGVTFNQLGLIQWFGEVSSGGGVGTQMGDGVFGSNSGSASISNATVITTLSSTSLASLTVNATDPGCFNSGWITPNYSFRYGGPGC